MAGDVVCLTESACSRYNWPAGARFEILARCKCERGRGPSRSRHVALLSDDGSRVRRANGREEHVTFPPEALQRPLSPAPPADESSGG